MKIIVPLAGPDFVRDDSSIKALTRVDGEALLKKALEGRYWAIKAKPEDYTFVFHDQHETRKFAADYLQDWYPGCTTIFLSRYTRGAALSALAGICTLSDFDEPLIIDLADIIFQVSIDVENMFVEKSNLGGIALTFQSHNRIYSYLRKDDTGRVVEAAEKRVISNEASAGVYIFRSSTVLLRSIVHALENEKSQTYNNIFYVCPLFNGVIYQGMDVETVSVDNIYDLKSITQSTVNYPHPFE